MILLWKENLIQEWNENNFQVIVGILQPENNLKILNQSRKNTTAFCNTQ
jgi:hypothetical protein